METPPHITAPIPPVVAASATPSHPPILSYQAEAIAHYPPSWTNVRIYGFPQEAIKVEIRHLIMRSIISYFMVAAILSGIISLYATFVPDPLILLYLGAGILLLIPILRVFRIWKDIYVLKGRWPTIRIITADQGILWACSGYPNLAISREKIKRIRESSPGIHAQGISSLHIIFIPRYTERFDEIRGHLATFHSIEFLNYYPLRLVAHFAAQFGILIALFGSLIGGYYFSQIGMELLCLGVLTGLCAWILYVSWRNPRSTLLQKIFSLWLILLPAILLLKILIWHLLKH